MQPTRASISGREALPTSPPIVVICGPTAVGKSALALELATRFPVAIVSADSRQVYRYMDIGTAKPTPEERSQTLHYMLDLVAPDDTYSAHRFREEANVVLRRIGETGRIALVVGGTGFYIRSLLDGMQLPPVPPNEDLRRRLRDVATAEGWPALHARLREVDPTSAKRIHVNNVSRVIRALEIIDYLNGPVPVVADAAPVPALFLALHRERESLYSIADQRVLRQIRAGLAEETRLLLAMGYQGNLPSMQGLGYREMIAYLRGELPLAIAIERFQAFTRQYIRRQLTWFRADRRLTWIDVAGRPAEVAQDLINRWLVTAFSGNW